MKPCLGVGCCVTLVSDIYKLIDCVYINKLGVSLIKVVQV